MHDDPPSGGSAPPDAPAPVPTAPPPTAPVPTADGSATLRHPRYGETFHSVHGAITEARHVYLEGAGLAERFARGDGARALEVGFGTGLNLLVTAAAARRAGVALEYVALEREIPDGRTLAALRYGERLDPPEGPGLARALLAARAALPEPPPEGIWTPALDAPPGAPPLRVEIRVGDAVAAPIEEGAYDAVLHDAFSPAVNPELWTPAFLARLAAALAPGGTLATYTVKGEVRRALAALGLEVGKRPGPPGGKRESLRARRPAP